MSFDVKFIEAIDVMRYLKENLRTSYYNEHQDSFIMSFEQLLFIVDSLLTNIDTAGSQQSFKKLIKANGINLPKGLPETLFRTILEGGFMAARWKRFMVTKETRPYLMYDAINDSRVRSNHLAMNGIIRRWDDPLWKTHFPPNGINCRCSIRSLSEDQAKERSKNRQGINKRIIKKMKPDNGWDFNVGEDLSGFIQVGIIALAKVGAVYSDC